MEEFREDWRIMPDEELLGIYRSKLREHKRLGTIAFAPLLPALVIYGFMGWLNFAGYEYGGFSAGGMNFVSGRAFYYVGLAVSSALINTAVMKNRWLIFLPVVISAVFVGLLFGQLSVEPLLMLCYLLYVYFRLGILLPDLDLLRSLPSFPFDRHSAERDIRIMSAKTAARHIDLSSGKVISNNCDLIFTEQRTAPPSSQTVGAHRVTSNDIQKKEN